MLHRRKFWILPLATIVGTGLFFGGCHHEPTQQQRAEWMVKKVSNELDLTKEQSEKLKSIVEKIQNQSPELKKVHSDIFNELYTQVKSDKVNAQKLNDVLIDNEKKFSQFIPSITAGFAEFHATLTAEQKTILAEKMEKFQKWSNH